MVEAHLDETVEQLLVARLSDAGTGRGTGTELGQEHRHPLLDVQRQLVADRDEVLERGEDAVERWEAGLVCGPHPRRRTVVDATGSVRSASVGCSPVRSGHLLRLGAEQPAPALDDDWVTCDPRPTRGCTAFRPLAARRRSDGRPLPEGTSAMHRKTPDPVATDAFVHLVADQLVADLCAGDLSPTLVHITDDGTDRLEVGVRPLDGRHPTDDLVGFRAPETWHALGMATSGWAYAMAERGDPSRTRSRVHVVTLVSRTGELAHRTHVIDDDDLARALRDTPEDPAGEQVDLLRLALGLPTAGPPCDSGVYWTIEWLSALLGADPAELRSWDAVAARHPAMALLRAEATTTVRSPDEFVATVAAFNRVCNWERLRMLVNDGGFAVPDLVAADAAWFDDGGFARFVLNRCPPLAMLRSQVQDQLQPGLSERLDQMLEALRVPATSWPDDRAA